MIQVLRGADPNVVGVRDESVGQSYALTTTAPTGKVFTTTGGSPSACGSPAATAAHAAAVSAATTAAVAQSSRSSQDRRKPKLGKERKLNTAVVPGPAPAGYRIHEGMLVQTRDGASYTPEMLAAMPQPQRDAILANATKMQGVQVAVPKFSIKEFAKSPLGAAVIAGACLLVAGGSLFSAKGR